MKSIKHVLTNELRYHFSSRLNKIINDGIIFNTRRNLFIQLKNELHDTIEDSIRSEISSQLKFNTRL